MKKTILTLILSIFLVGLLSATSVNTYYNLNLNYNKGEITLLSNEIEQSLDLIDNSVGEYSVALFDYKGNILDIYFFDVPNEVIYDALDENGTISGGGEMILDEVNFTLSIPYYKNATRILIYDQNVTRKLEIDVSFYSKEYEQYKEFNATNQNVSDEEEPANQVDKSVNDDVTKEKTFFEKLSNYWWVLLIILLILLVIIINYIRK